MAYKRSDYGANPHAGRARNNAEARGWGSGWPNCQWDKFVVVERAGVRVSTRREIAELVATLFTATEQRGYDILKAGVHKCGGTWGTACRAIRGTNVASNHSWGLAIDINAPCNPMASYFKTDIPPEVVKIWEACGFYWGGRYSNRPDTMHFEYIGRPSDVAADLKKAKSFLTGGGGSAPPSGDGSGGSTGGGSSDEYESFNKTAKPGERTLRRGSAGNDVETLQRFLGQRRVGNDDGYFGPKTERGVRAYQRMRGLAVDGIVGPNTWRHILSALNRKPRKKAPRPTIRKGSRNGHVKTLQAHLKKVYPAYAKHLTVDGIFGPQTERAVKEFQRRSKIAVDGIVGPQTWGKLGI